MTCMRSSSKLRWRATKASGSTRFVFWRGGKPEMCDEIFAFSLGNAVDDVPGVIFVSTGLLPACGVVDTSMGDFRVGGVAGEVASFTVVKMHEDAPPAPPRLRVELHWGRRDLPDAHPQPL
ncbi:hypothetical protein CYMTET_55490 [Cymbomonas tetramitiformis]|uniref:Uncharacterized protein n=1 Tax=Cymbomonas tetramitiformis TaxID=36881 RepID=A0AAE0BCX5_9CHLO|nr:hypothetical protein CYMTET_55490 [Cymbomonas tetramitiformis]